MLDNLDVLLEKNWFINGKPYDIFASINKTCLIFKHWVKSLFFFIECDDWFYNFWL